MGPPGFRKKEKALTLNEEFKYTTISVGDLLGREINKKSEYGKKIRDAKSKFVYGNIYVTVAPDDIVIELVRQYILDPKNEEENFIIEGYPRTCAQAIELQKMKVVPDKFFILTASEASMLKKAIAKIDASDEGKNLSEAEIEKYAKNSVTEYTMFF